MSTKFVIWKSKPNKARCVIDRLSGVTDNFGLTHGVPLASTVEGPLNAKLHPGWLSSTTEDNVANVLGVIVASERLTMWFHSRGVAHLEYLPVTLFNHHGEEAERLWLIHPINCVDALDFEGAAVEPSFFVPDEIESIMPLRLRPNAVPTDQPLFRCKNFTEIFIRSDFANALSSEGITGLSWVPLDS